jgi:hypothetical protein
MARLPPRLRQALSKIRFQWLLVGLVAVGAATSAVRSSRLHPEATAGRREATRAAPDPEEEGDRLSQPVEDALSAAKDGNLDRYMDQFADPLRGQLARTRAEKGDAYLRDYLARLTGPLKGLAVHVDRKEAIGPGAARVPVEFIYADRNETQSFSLQQDAGRWRITRIDTVRATQTLIPYGTPIEQVR